jgi:hypothetical protein
LDVVRVLGGDNVFISVYERLGRDCKPEDH